MTAKPSRTWFPAFTRSLEFRVPVTQPGRNESEETRATVAAENARINAATNALRIDPEFNRLCREARERVMQVAKEHGVKECKVVFTGE